MLVLSRQYSEVVVLGGLGSPYPEMRVTLVDIRGDKIRLGFDAPIDCPIHREEVFNAIQANGKESA